MRVRSEWGEVHKMAALVACLGRAVKLSPGRQLTGRARALASRIHVVTAS
jgi:hypothetical protein